MLFGDGAGAAVLEYAETDDDSLSGIVLGSDGAGYNYIIKEGGSRKSWTPDPVHDFTDTVPTPYLDMDGHAVFTFAVRKLDEVVKELCAKASISIESLDYIFAHQANLRIIDAVARRMKQPMERFYLNLAEIGNTSSASIPLCLDKAVREGTLKDGMRIALAGFGSGLTWAGALMKWPYM